MPGDLSGQSSSLYESCGIGRQAFPRYLAFSRRRQSLLPLDIWAVDAWPCCVGVGTDDEHHQFRDLIDVGNAGRLNSPCHELLSSHARPTNAYPASRQRHWMKYSTVPRTYCAPQPITEVLISRFSWTGFPSPMPARHGQRAPKLRGGMCSPGISFRRNQPRSTVCLDSSCI
jgi:hypothetical protein